MMLEESQTNALPDADDRLSRNLCPECGMRFLLKNINIEEGVALCQACGMLSRLGAVAESAQYLAEYIKADDRSQKAPNGCTIENDGQRIILRASCRSLPTAAVALAVAFFWNGITSIFVIQAISGLRAHLFGGSQIEMSHRLLQANGNPLPLMHSIGLFLFMLPFVAIGIAMIGALMMALFGDVRVVVDDVTGMVSTGIGSIRRNRRFDATAVKRIVVEDSSTNDDGARKVIRLEANRTIKFASFLTSARRAWMLITLRQLLLLPPPLGTHV